MKLIAVMIASLCLIATSWAQDEHTKDGRKKPMQTQKDITMVAQPLVSTHKVLLPNYGSARDSRRGTAAS